MSSPSATRERSDQSTSRAIDAMLAGTVTLWALNIVVTRYMVTTGWSPLAYATLRYFVAIALFIVYTYRRERSFAIERRDIKLVLLAGALIFGNQVCFVYALKFARASTIALLFGATPMFIGVFSFVLGLERLGRAFWAGTVLTSIGVAVVALASGSVGSSAKGVLLGIGMDVTWGAYTLAIRPMMRRYSPFRISSLVLPIGWIPLAIIGSGQVVAQHFGFGWLVWLGFAYSVVGPLFLTNILWFTAIDRVGPSRAALFANFEPFAAVVFAVLLLGDKLYPLELVGGVLILAGIMLERVWTQVSAPAITPID